MMHAEAQLSKVAPYHLPPPRVLEFQRVPAIRPGLLTPLPLPAELPQLPSKPGPQASTQKWGAFSCGSCCFFSSRKKWRHHQVETKWLTREVPLQSTHHVNMYIHIYIYCTSVPLLICLRVLPSLEPWQKSKPIFYEPPYQYLYDRYGCSMVFFSYDSKIIFYDKNGFLWTIIYQS